ncbi:hypothetical protein Poli38472_014900 [Pythium oligandrum]|uniref:Uncharacterized protein n=1 Tax=Pythium oligandrum TaxID=41045 RepID=A0A8K1C6X5_PYTOL|nr:hypothetical protein Poli38472_014900 [Pythium oligandrum]|eukprot:TMW57667.1 hypothetical protein Poli38472_014900 [Pythium oligandrum]
MRKHATALLNVFDRSSEKGEAIDLVKIFNSFTIETFAEMGFGIKMNCLDAEEEHPLQSAFDSAQRMVVLRYQRPSFVWKLQRLFGIGAEKQLKQDIKVIDDTVFDIISKALANRQNQKATDNTKPRIHLPRPCRRRRRRRRKHRPRLPP